MKTCYSIAITEDGCVYACGWGADGQTGLGHYENVSKFTRVQGDIANERIVKVAGRCDFVIALSGECTLRANLNSNVLGVAMKLTRFFLFMFLCPID